MQSRNINLNSVSSDNGNSFKKTSQSASLERNNDDYLDLVLRKEINLWFKKNSAGDNQPGIVEPVNAYPINEPSSVINLGYSGD